METIEKINPPIYTEDNSQCHDHKPEELIERTSQLMDLLRSGCVCNTKAVPMIQGSKESAQKLGAFLYDMLYVCSVSDELKIYGESMLIFMTFLRTLARSAIYPTCYSNNDEIKEVYCKGLWEWQVVVRRMKYKILPSLLKVWKVATVEDEAHVKYEAEVTFAHLLLILACPVQTLEGCRKTCHKIMHSCIQLNYSHKIAITPGFVLRLLHIMFCELEEEPDVKRQKQLMNNSSSCTTAKVFVKRDGYSHLRSLRQSTIADLRQHWRTIWVENCIGNNANLDYDHILQFYDIWRALVAVNTNVPYSAMRDFVTPTLVIVDNLSPETDISIKWKQLDVLNEVLCYGSTLGIQSDIPVEASEVAQRLLRGAQSVNFFENFYLPSSPAGMAGSSKIKTLATEEMPLNMPILQKVVILYLKAIAVVVRESQAVSSSDESASDSSLSSRGSSSVAEEEREMRLIGGNVLHLLNCLRRWINDKICRHHTSNLVATVCELFNDQDDSLIESLLCLLDIHTTLNANHHMKISYIQDESANITEVNASMSPALSSEDMVHYLDLFHPIDGFDCLIQSISSDHSVILDFLLSNETCFLLYFLRILKYFNRTPMSLCSHPSNVAVQEILHKTWTSIKKLTNKSLFPYDISPVLKLLEKVVSNFESIEKIRTRQEIVVA